MNIVLAFAAVGEAATGAALVVNPSLRRFGAIPAPALLAGVLLVLAPVTVVNSAQAAAAATEGPQAPEAGGAQLLLGRWVRPDGGYVLELKEIGKDGVAQAAYYNPRSINVRKASVSRSDGALVIFVELRDVNYPGSQYALRYDPKTDQLIGSYFQAVERQYYTVGFVRVR